jgi:hypothetical protein
MLTRAIGPQWAAVWRGVRDPLSAPWASSPGGVVWFIGQGGAGPRHLAAAVGKPADSMENVIQDRGDVVNRSGWTDGRSTPYPVRRIGHPRTRRYIRLLDGRAVATGIRPNRRSPEPGAFIVPDRAE